jgi:acetylornithine deacetylase/succinyl-diaminopimelate desuccinylase-like protein
MPASARPYLLPAAHWGNRAAHRVLAKLYGREPYYTRMGGSIPVCDLFRTHLGADTVMLGFGLPDEQFHAPDEFFRLSSFERGQRAYAMLLEGLTAHAPSAGSNHAHGPGS